MMMMMMCVCVFILPVCFTRPHGMFLVLYRVTKHMAGAPPLTERNWYIYIYMYMMCRLTSSTHIKTNTCNMLSASS